LRYVFRPEDALGKSHNLLSINAFKAQGVDFEHLIVSNAGMCSTHAGIVCQVNLPETRLHHRIIACIKIFTA